MEFHYLQALLLQQQMKQMIIDNINAVNLAKSGSFITSCGEKWYYEISCVCNDIVITSMIMQLYRAAEEACGTPIIAIEP